MLKNVALSCLSQINSASNSARCWTVDRSIRWSTLESYCWILRQAFCPFLFW